MLRQSWARRSPPPRASPIEAKKQAWMAPTLVPVTIEMRAGRPSSAGSSSRTQDRTPAS